MQVRRLRQLWERLHSSYWFVPTVMAMASLVLAKLCLFVDQGLSDNWWPKPGWMYSGGPDGARAVLSTVAGSIITVAGTTFSITVASLSLASSQFGPRLLRNFIRDTGNQIVLGTYTATFLYCLLILRTVRGGDDDHYVPHVSVTISVVLAVLSVGVLIYFIHHVAESIQVSHLAQRVAAELNEAVERLFPERGSQAAPVAEAPAMTDAAKICSRVDGYVQTVDAARLTGLATEHNVVIALRVRPGDYLFRGIEIAAVMPQSSASIRDSIAGAVSVGRVRTTLQDAEFGFLQLSEIALRALSPGINDPFTAILCIDYLSSAMVRLVDRRLPDAVQCDNSGNPRLIANPYTYRDFTRAAFVHIIDASGGHAVVRHRLRAALLQVLERTGDTDFRIPLSEALERLHQG